MKKQHTFLRGSAVIVVGVVSFFTLTASRSAVAQVGGWVPSTVSNSGEKLSNEGQKSATLPDLTDFASLQKVFHQEEGSVRLVALLSASCPYCIKGYRYMRKILDEVSDERLRMYVVWEPMLSGDTKALSYEMSKKVIDPRMVYQAWDGERITGKTWTRVMLDGDERWFANGPAWDVYFLYSADAKWGKSQPSVPTYWQHQGAGSRELMLNYKKLKAKIEELLVRRDDKAN